MKILIFAAHPDDAEVVVGGSICRYTDAGHSVHVVNMTNNRTKRVACAHETSEILGFTFEFMDLNDVIIHGDDPNYLGVRFDPEQLKLVREKIEEYHPDLIWAHWPVDTHADHIAAGSLVLRATDQIRMAGDWHPDLWFFAPELGYQAVCFVPNHFEDITPFVERKKQAILVYDKVVTILRNYVIDETGHRYYGYVSGYKYAEGFVKCNFRVGKERYEIADSEAPDQE